MMINIADRVDGKTYYVKLKRPSAAFEENIFLRWNASLSKFEEDIEPDREYPEEWINHVLELGASA